MNTPLAVRVDRVLPASTCHSCFWRQYMHAGTVSCDTWPSQLTTQCLKWVQLKEQTQKGPACESMDACDGCTRLRCASPVILKNCPCGRWCFAAPCSTTRPHLQHRSVHPCREWALRLLFIHGHIGWHGCFVMRAGNPATFNAATLGKTGHVHRVHE